MQSRCHSATPLIFRTVALRLSGRQSRDYNSVGVTYTHRCGVKDSKMNWWLFLRSLLCLLCLWLLSACLCGGTDYYVKPSLDSECPAGELPCKTLDEYVKDTQYLQGSQITLLFLVGIHNLTAGDLNIISPSLQTFQMKPFYSDVEANETVVIKRLCCTILFQSMTNLTLDNISIESSTRETSPSLVFKNITQVICQCVHLVGVSMLVTLEDRPGIWVNFSFIHSILEQSNGTGLRIIDHRSQGNSEIWLTNSIVSHHQQGGIVVNYNAVMTVTIHGSTIEKNSITRTLGPADNAAGLSVYSEKYRNETIIDINNSTFAHNRDLRPHSSATLQDLRGQQVVVYVLNAFIINIVDCDFHDNHGTAIGAVNVAHNLRFYGNVTFHRNKAQRGGALALVSTQIYFKGLTHVSFVNNSAKDVGGAIFVESTSTVYEESNPDTHTYCFYLFPDLARYPNPLISFENNIATNGGHHIYGASLMSYCIGGLENSTIKRSNYSEIRRLFHIDKHIISPISSKPHRVCLLEASNRSHNVTRDCTNKSQIFTSISAIPGEEFQLKAVLVGAEFGTSSGTVYARFLSIGSSKAHLSSSNQYYQRLKFSLNVSVNYSVFSNNSCEVLVLSAADGTISEMGDKNETTAAIKKYERYKVIPALLLTTPVYINVSLSKCPPGFYHDQHSLGCKCNPKVCSLTSQTTWKLVNGSGVIYAKENIWVNVYNESGIAAVILHQNCPFDYCKAAIDRAAGMDLHYTDTQCAMNRTGTLCGKCRHGYSLAIGSNRCLPCQNNNGLSLLIFFAAAGLLLVFFVTFLNMTVTQGTINGLIFYANIIWAYQNVFISGKTQFLYTFVAWINLDFGIEICFFQGLTAFGKTWLQFLFPLYIWSIAGVMILLARYSKRVTKLIGNNSVHVLATLFLLSYAKLLRIVIVVLFPATLSVYEDDEKPAKLLNKVVWAIDGNLSYGSSPHIVLLVIIVFILVVFLCYSLILLFIKPLRSHSGHTCLRWVETLKPIIDAYVGALSPLNQHWVGLLLVARFILLLTFTLTYANDPNAGLLALVIVTVFLFCVLSYTGRLYENSRPKSILELSFLFNLTVVGVSVLYIR